MSEKVCCPLAVQHERISANKNRKSKRISGSSHVQDRALADSTTPATSNSGSGVSLTASSLSTLVPRNASASAAGGGGGGGIGQRPVSSYPWLNGNSSSTFQLTTSNLDSPESACPRLLFSAGMLKDVKVRKRQVVGHLSGNLFLISTVSWALSIPAFQALQPSDQQLLLEESLLELMVVTALQFRGEASTAVVQGQLTCFIGLTDSAKLEELIKCMSSFSPPLNQLEFTSLKALLLFKPGSYTSTVTVTLHSIYLLH